MTKLAMFVPLAKADAAQRLVYGSIDETPDRAREIMDYATAKVAFQSWSDGLYKASGGKSYGNVRAQHDLKKAAGVLREIVFDDEAKSISFCAHIVDDAEWAKVDAGVYTGFSPGGSYAKRWPDAVVAGHNRYTPSVGELSIVDVPCIPSANFTMVKADGTEALIDFVLAKAYEPGNDATKARAEEMAKAAEGTTFKDHVVQARADLIAENATEALAKMAEAVEEPATPDRAAALEAALAKADSAVTAAAPKVAIDGPEIELAKALEEIATALEGHPLAKGLRGIQSLAGVIYQVVAIQSGIAREAEREGDGSPVPGQVADGIKTLCDALVAMAQEEVAELLTDINAAGLEEEAYDWGQYACAAPIIDLIKADTVLMEKAGKRNSKGDAAKIQSMHDNSIALGATCAVAKAAGLEAENERLNKAVDAALPRLEKMAEDLGRITAESDAKDIELAKRAEQIKALGNLAAPTKAELAHAKENDTLAKAVDPEVNKPVPFLESLTKASPAERRNMILGARPR